MTQGHCVRLGPSSPSQKGDRAPQFLTHVYCGQTAAWIKLPLGMEVGLGPGHIVLDGDPASPPQNMGHSPPIAGPCLLWPNGWMNQDATWYDGRPRPGQHCVRCKPSSTSNGHNPHPHPNFGPCLLWSNGWMDQDATWYEGRPYPRPLCVTWGPGSRLQQGAQPPNFRPMSIVARWLPILATAEHFHNSFTVRLC